MLFSAIRQKQNVLITVDVEDWFQVENFKSVISYETWESRELRVERNVYRLLDLFDNVWPDKGGLNPPKVTFFILGWIARKQPRLVKAIQNRGHEVASHGFYHHLCNHQNPKDLLRDLIDSRQCLEDIIGDTVFGYRAPSFSISNDILKLIEESGYRYDSSFNSFGFHGRYGKINLSKYPRNGIAYVISRTFHELPVSNLAIFRKTLPWGGGGYFRFFPFPLFLQGVKSIIKKDSAYLFYMHPWEIDPMQPRVKDIPRSYKLRHYINLDKTYTRLNRLIAAFEHCHFPTVNQYLQSLST